MDEPRGTRSRRPVADDARPERPGRVLGAVGLLAVAVVAGALAGPWDPPMRSADTNWVVPQPTESPQDFGGLPTLPPELFDQADLRPWDLRWLGAVFLLVVLAWIVTGVVLWFRKLPPPRVPEGPDDAGIDLDRAFVGPGTVVPDLPALRVAVAEAEAELRRFARPVDAVIAAWVRLEAAAARSGLRRDPASTPTEFTVKVLDSAPVDPQATRTLLDLYLRARFGEERMTPADVRAAVSALSVLALGLGDPEDADTSGWRLAGSDAPVGPSVTAVPEPETDAAAEPDAEADAEPEPDAEAAAEPDDEPEALPTEPRTEDS